MRERSSRAAAWPAVALAVGLAAGSWGCGGPAVEEEKEAASAAAPGEAAEGAAGPCAPGTTCLDVDADGSLNPEGTSVAQCSGVFPDYIVPKTLLPAGYAGPWFKLSQDFPAALPAPAPLPWSG